MIKTKRMMVLDKGMERVPLTFTRASVAYDYQGNSVPVNTPRFEHLIGGNIERGVLIEEAHTNLLTAGASQSIANASPYTTGTLNGTYTFQCEGTGSYVLSGGATGTVSKDNPVTANVSSATVTLTPITTSTLNQIIKLAYPLSWTLGGTTQAIETLTVPDSVLNIINGTIEIEAYIPSTHKASGYDWDIFSHYQGVSTSYNNIRVYHSGTAQKVRIMTRDNSGNLSYTDGFADNTITTGWNDFTARYNSASIIITKNGDTAGQSTETTVKMPSAKGFVWIGSYIKLYTFNSLIKNVVISKSKRSDTEVLARSNTPGFGADREVTLFAPLTHNLQAYKIARG